MIPARLRALAYLSVFCLAAPAAAEKLIWSQSVSDRGYQMASRLLTDRNGDLILGGVYKTYPGRPDKDSLAFGYEDIFLHKLDPMGKTIWFRHIGTPFYPDSPFPDRFALDVDPAGRIYLAGWCPMGGRRDQVNPMWFTTKGGDTVTADSSGGQFFICQYGPDGTLAWVRQFSRSSNMVGMDIRALPDGFIFTAISKTRSDPHGVAFHLHADSLPAQTNQFLAGGDAQGANLWLKRVNKEGDSASGHPFTLRVDREGGRYVDSTGGYLEYWNSQSKLQWKHLVGKEGSLGWLEVLPDTGGEAFLYGRTGNGFIVTLAGGRDTVLAYRTDSIYSFQQVILKVNSRGENVWARSLPASEMGRNFLSRDPVCVAPDHSLIFIRHLEGSPWARIDASGRDIATNLPHAGENSENGMSVAAGPSGHFFFAISYYLTDYTFLGKTFANSEGTTNFLLARADLDATLGLLGGKAAPARTRSRISRTVDGLGRIRLKKDTGKPGGLIFRLNP